jgi:hypothetical protein
MLHQHRQLSLKAAPYQYFLIVFNNFILKKMKKKKKRKKEGPSSLATMGWPATPILAKGLAQRPLWPVWVGWFDHLMALKNKEGKMLYSHQNSHNIFFTT